MSDDLNRLESEVGALLAPLAERLDAAPPEGVVHRVRAAARHALNEAWLADQPTAAPPAGTVGRVQAAVRDAITNTRPETLRPVSDPSLNDDAEALVKMPGGARWRGLSSLAAAAMVGICVGLIHHVGTLNPMAEHSEPAQELLDRFVQAEDALTEDPWALSVSAGLDAIERSINEWEPVEDYNTELLDQLAAEIDELLAESGAERSTSQAPAGDGSVIG
jgi:hypothetical protein